MTNEIINLTIEARSMKMAFTTARINAAVDAAQVTATHVQLHTGAPGAAGTSNVAAGVARAVLTKGAAGTPTAKVAVDTATWTIPGAGGPYTHCSLWDALTVGTFCGDGVLTPQESFAGTGTLAVTVTVTGT